jgi:hypothetical protein
LLRCTSTEIAFEHQRWRASTQRWRLSELGDAGDRPGENGLRIKAPEDSD